MSKEFAGQFDCSAASPGVFMRVFGRGRSLAGRFSVVSLGVLSLADQAIVSATSFATMVIIGRTTSPDELGIYYLILSIVFISVGVQEQTVATPFTIYSKRYQDRELASYAGSAWLHHFSLTAIGFAVLLATILVLSWGDSVQIVPGLWALLGAGPFLLLREWIRKYSYADLQIIPAVALDATVAAFQLGGLLLLWRWQSLSIISVFAVMGAACAVASLGWVLIARPAAHFDRSRFASDWQLNWSFARWSLQSYVVGNTIPYILPWILVAAVGAAAAGVLAACNTLINFSNVFLISVDRVLVPRAAQAYADGGTTALRRVLTFASLIVLPVLGAFCLFMFAIGGRVAVFVFGDQFAGHAPILSALAAAMFANGVGTITGTGLWAINQPKTNFAADLVTLLITIGVALVSVVPLGALGAALAILAGTSSGCIVRTIRLHQSLATIEKSDFEWRNDFIGSPS